MISSETSIVISSAVQAVATAILVGVTIFYAIQTKKTVDSMDKNSKADFLPILMLGINPKLSSDKKLLISLENVGKGLAKRPVELRFPGVGPIRLNSMNVGEKTSAIIKYDIDHILDIPINERKISVSYRDIFDREIKTEAELKEKNTLGPEGKNRGIAWDSWTPIIP